MQMYIHCVMSYCISAFSDVVYKEFKQNFQYGHLEDNWKMKQG